MGRGLGTLKGSCRGARVPAPPLSGGLRCSHRQAVAGSTGGGLRGLWAARRGLKAPPGGVRAPLRYLGEPEWARSELQGTPEETGTGDS